MSIGRSHVEGREGKASTTTTCLNLKPQYLAESCEALSFRVFNPKVPEVRWLPKHYKRTCYSFFWFRDSLYLWQNSMAKSILLIFWTIEHTPDTLILTRVHSRFGAYGPFLTPNSSIRKPSYFGLVGPHETVPRWKPRSLCEGLPWKSTWLLRSKRWRSYHKCLPPWHGRWVPYFSRKSLFPSFSRLMELVKRINESVKRTSKPSFAKEAFVSRPSNQKRP